MKPESIVNSEMLASEDFWRKFAPQLHITDLPFLSGKPAISLDAAMKERIRRQMIEDGYFQTLPLFDEDEIGVLRDLVADLHVRGIMPLFAAVYDEYWQTLSRLGKLLTPVLGPDYRMVPDFWVWYVAADDSFSGWAPHRDGAFLPENIRDDGTPKLCTAWIPLTDVETTNSCIYVLPRKHDALFQDFIRKKYGQTGIRDAEKIPLPMERIRALPVQSGSLLGWDQNLLHWGSGSSKWAAGPRISAGAYFQAADTGTVGRSFDSSGRIEIDCDNPMARLTLRHRLSIIANNMETYGDKLDKGLVHEPNYNAEFRNFREDWKWPAGRAL